MSKTDLELSIKRHATSKIQTQEDLEAIKTLGFRGEALPSISSVSHLEMLTRTMNNQLGYKLTSEPNKPPQIEEVSCNKGTQVLVKNLFYNVPARRKFLKNNLTEFKYISETVIRFALSNPNIRFTFYDDDSLIFDLNPSDLETRIVATLGKVVKDLIIPLEYEEGSIKINGFIGKPFLARQNSSNQYLFLNGRIIKNRYINHAIVSCYEELLDEKKFPFYVLFLTIAPDQIDINVHPQKHEVKFENDKVIYNIVKNAINSALRKVNLIPEFKVETDINYRPFQIERDSDNKQVVVNRNTGEILDSWGKPSSHKHSGGFSEQFNVQRETKMPSNSDIAQIFEQYEETKFEFLSVDDRFLIVKEKEHLLVIYKRRAVQRIYYELLVNSIRSSQIESQELLFPEEVQLELKLLDSLRHHSEHLKDFGFLMEFQAEAVHLLSVPEAVHSNNLQILIERIASNLYDTQHNDKEEIHDYLAKIIAISIKVNQGEYSSEDELKKLYEKLFRCKNPHQSPTGKLTSFSISFSELEKKFRL
jgi:DNA mismatch repair protein MutL